MFQFIRNHTDEEDIIVFSNPRTIRLMTDRIAIACFMEKDIPMGDYVVIREQERLEGRYRQASKDLPQRETLFENAGFTAIKLRRNHRGLPRG